MAQSTPRVQAPLLAAAQAQKHVTHNEALIQLDALLNARILDRDLSAPPAVFADGDAYLVKAVGGGAWAGQDGKIAFAVDGAWRFYAPFAGLTVFVADESVILVYTAAGWKDWSSIVNLQNVPLVGVNTVADATNKFALKSNAALFAALEAANGGTGDMRVKLNKETAAATGSFLFQTNWSGRAEFGLTGDDDFHIKVSSNGVTWHGGIDIARATGAVSFPNSDYATKSGAETLNNKTLSSPVFSGTATNFKSTGMTDQAASTVVTITSAGRYGINTPSPMAALHFTFNSITTDAIGVTDTSTNDPRTWRFGPGAGSSGTFGFYDGNNLNLALASTSFGRAVMPGTDNNQNLGTASQRWATVFAGTGTINTSGAATKTDIRALSGAEIAAAKALAANTRIFQFCDAVAKKKDAARLHTGTIYEEASAAFAAEGLDPERYAIFCRDPAMKTVTRTRTIKRPKMRTVTVEREVIEVANGVATLTMAVETREEPVLKEIPLVDTAGAPVLDLQTGLQRLHFAPIMEDVEETYQEEEPDFDENGVQKWILGLRYGELAQFAIAGLAARLAALEAR